MEIFNTLQTTLQTLTCSIQTLKFNKLAPTIFSISPAQAAEYPTTIKANQELPSFSNSNRIKLDSPINSIEPLMVHETRVYCVVNKYNELVKASSRLIYSSNTKAKPIYCLFISKHDALDFLYKIANNSPSSFKKSGLGINSFSLKQYFDLVKKNKSNADMILLNDLQELEAFINKSKSVSGKYKYVINKNVNFKQPISDMLAYRINPYDKSNNFSHLSFIHLDDAINFWKTNLNTNQRRLTIELFTISPKMIEKANFIA